MKTTLWANAIVMLAAACGSSPEPAKPTSAAGNNHCAPRCECGPPGEYTWCCDCQVGLRATTVSPEFTTTLAPSTLWTTSLDLAGDGVLVPLRISHDTNDKRSLLLTVGERAPVEIVKVAEGLSPRRFFASALPHKPTHSTLLIVQRPTEDEGRFASYILQVFPDWMQALPSPLLSVRAMEIPLWRVLGTGEIEMTFRDCVQSRVTTTIVTFEISEDADRARLRYARKDQESLSQEACP